jgi:tetratricopeptide (TPR) repeat protein
VTTSTMRKLTAFNTVLLAALAGCAHAPSMVASAWGTGDGLPRPAAPVVPCCSDPKDPETFIALGDGMLERGRADSAAAAFYWASRLDPTLAEPYYARSVALLLTYARRVDQEFTTDIWLPVAEIPPWRKAIIDSLRREAQSRDPFLRPRLDHLLTGRPPIFMIAKIREPAALGYWLYDLGQEAQADSVLGIALAKTPGHAHLRELRARAEYELSRYDSAAVQLRLLLDTLSHRDSTSLALGYASKEIIYYALGYTDAQRKDTTAARLDFENALGENAAFYPAHARLATLADARGDVATAIKELASAIELAPEDPTLRFFYGAALLDAGHAGQAAAELLKAIDLDPYFAKPYRYLGKAHEARADPERAADAYEDYANHERFNEAQRVWARAYADTLRMRMRRAP